MIKKYNIQPISIENVLVEYMYFKNLEIDYNFQRQNFLAHESSCKFLLKYFQKYLFKNFFKVKMTI